MMLKSVELRAARSRTDIWFSPEEPLEPHDPLRAAMPVGNGICHAFYVADQLVGTAALGRLAAHKPFTAAQVNLLHTFVDFLAIQIVNARLLAERTAAQCDAAGTGNRGRHPALAAARAAPRVSALCAGRGLPERLADRRRFL